MVGRALVANRWLAGSARGKQQRGQPLNAGVSQHSQPSGSIKMLFSNPREWAKSAVGSWWRFAFMAVGNTAFILYAVYIAAESGLRSGLSIVVMPVLFQLMFLYALRRIYRQAIGAEALKSAV
jgi:hypothetical protein